MLDGQRAHIFLAKAWTTGRRTKEVFGADAQGGSDPVALWHQQDGVSRRIRDYDRCASRLDDGKNGWPEGNGLQDQGFSRAEISLAGGFFFLMARPDWALNQSGVRA